MQHFYDGQVRRYITQMIRLMSNFTYKDGDDKLTTVPVMYGDITRQVGSIIRDNSENKIPSTPRMSVYVTGLEMDRSRTGDSSYVNKLNIRERAYDSAGQEYLNKEGKNYTVERLMPSPYTMTVNVDIWSSNTEQKLQILEQILMLFNPSLEIQTTDNYVDWTSLTVVNMESITWSSRSIPVGTETEIDVSSLTLNTPIYISPPAKVKRLGVITNIVTSIFDESGTVDINVPTVSDFASADLKTRIAITETGEIENIRETKDLKRGSVDASVTISHNSPELLVMNNTIQLVVKGVAGGETWPGYLKSIPSLFQDGVTQVRLKRVELDSEIAGTISIDPNNPKVAIVNWDDDTIPSDEVITGPNGDRSKIDYIIDPIKTNPEDWKANGGTPRILLLGDIGNTKNTDGADAWKNNDGTDFIASANDIVEWSGTAWSIVFDASANTSLQDTIYTTNLKTGIQYRWDGSEWLLSFEGEYPVGTWRLEY